MPRLTNISFIIIMYHSYPEQSRARPDHSKAAPVDAQVNHYYFYYHYVSFLP